MPPDARSPTTPDDDLSRLKGEYLAAGHQRDNLFWGWIRSADP